MPESVIRFDYFKHLCFFPTHAQQVSITKEEGQRIAQRRLEQQLNWHTRQPISMSLADTGTSAAAVIRAFSPTRRSAAVMMRRQI
jgi:hypothetical protein